MKNNDNTFHPIRYAVACPYCNAPKGEFCKRPGWATRSAACPPHHAARVREYAKTKASN